MVTLPLNPKSVLQVCMLRATRSAHLRTTTPLNEPLLENYFLRIPANAQRRQDRISKTMPPKARSEMVTICLRCCD